ncbi:MAG: hypothetical protein ACKODX_22580 [Gemmata sp.]|jgi:hypothetical protein
MKWLLMFACAILVGCGLIYGIAHAVLPHLIAPHLLPHAQAREAPRGLVARAVACAGGAVGSGISHGECALASR